jgi:nucleoporin NUP1|uniref:Uncharacterized protein n=1 Tax=Sipha flava TaxID=143950 RepID=A0A2S2QIP1_9HEMI
MKTICLQQVLIVQLKILQRKISFTFGSNEKHSTLVMQFGAPKVDDKQSTPVMQFGSLKADEKQSTPVMQFGIPKVDDKQLTPVLQFRTTKDAINPISTSLFLFGNNQKSIDNSKTTDSIKFQFGSSKPETTSSTELKKCSICVK